MIDAKTHVLGRNLWDVRGQSNDSNDWSTVQLDFFGSLTLDLGTFSESREIYPDANSNISSNYLQALFKMIATTISIVEVQRRPLLSWDDFFVSLLSCSLDWVRKIFNLLAEVAGLSVSAFISKIICILCYFEGGLYCRIKLSWVDGSALSMVRLFIFCLWATAVG